MNISPLVISLIRTYVPLAVGFFLAWLASTLHIVINPSSETQLAGLTVLVLSALYSTLVHLAEKRWPSTGILLGFPRVPHYPAAAETRRAA